MSTSSTSSALSGEQEQSGEAQPARARKKKVTAERKPKKAKKTQAAKPRKKRTQRPYPAVAFKEAKIIGDGIWKHGAGDRIRRLTLFEKLGMSTTSSSTNMAITNSGKYKITVGGYSAEWLSLTELGKIACDPTGSPRAVLDASFKLAIDGVEPFKALYDEYSGKRLVAPEVMRDLLDSKGFDIPDLAECVDLFVTNSKDLKLLRPIAGAETFIPIEQALDEAGTAPLPLTTAESVIVVGTTAAAEQFGDVCFYVTPIGDVGSEERKHSDLFKTAIVEPAVKELGLRVVRADEIGTPGMITSAIIEYLKRSKLVVADLSFANPNVYYEIALRHTCKLPIIQIMRKGERLPFDVNQVNTVTIDKSDLYTFVPQIASFIAEVATLARNALQNPERVSNPITVFYPTFWE